MLYIYYNIYVILYNIYIYYVIYNTCVCICMYVYIVICISFHVKWTKAAHNPSQTLMKFYQVKGMYKIR